MLNGDETEEFDRPPSHLILEQPLLIPIDQGYTR